MGRESASNIKQSLLALPGARTARPGFVRQSGGLRWHLRAFMGRNRHADFRAGIAGWLAAWRPPTDGLILVGPSGGWCLPTDFLKRWVHIVVIDLDPLAPWLLRWRHGLRAEIRCADFVDELPRALESFPGHAVLFANLLGQLPLERSDHEHVIARVGAVLGGRHWASFHDRYSAEVDPKQSSAARAIHGSRAMTPEMLQQLGLAREWVDHGTEHLFPSRLPRHYFPWRISDRRLHWVEAGVVAPEDGLDLPHAR